MNLADLIAITKYRIRCIIEKYFPSPPAEFVKCGEKDCLNRAVIKMIDVKIGFQVDVCLDHFRELRNQRDWDLE